MGESDMNHHHKIAVGIDVCKSFLDAFHSVTEQHQRFENSPKGLIALVDWLNHEPAPDIVIMEASGGYEMPCWTTLCAAHIPTARINPKRSRDFARAIGVLAKTDRLDAHILAQYGLAVEVAPQAPKSRKLQIMEDWLIRRKQLVEMRVAESNRRRLLSSVVQKRIDMHLRQLDREIERIDNILAENIQSMPQWREKLTLIEGIKGVGPNTKAWLIAGLPELGHLNRRQIAAMVGVAPLTHESGSYKGRRRIHGGRATIRTALYLATLSAVRHDPRMREFYQRLLSAGKPKKVALVAAMRKLLTIINAVFRSGQPYCAKALETA